MSINTIATDRHRGVGALMKTDYPYITHQYDVWHMAKSVVKQLTQKGKLKHCEQLLPWIQSISNHLWWAAQTCNGDAQLLTEKWTSIIYHLFNKCVHPTFPPEEQHSKKWLRSGSLVHTTLKNIVYNTTLLQDIKILTGFHHTDALEVFHSLILKYYPKRQHFSYVGMQVQIELAILDHNYSTNRKQVTTNKGMLIFNTNFDWYKMNGINTAKVTTIRSCIQYTYVCILLS